jgi:hypothetical protein
VQTWSFVLLKNFSNILKLCAPKPARTQSPKPLPAIIPDNKMRPTIIKYTLLLLVGQLISWWTFFFSPFDIPDKIPQTPIKIDGIILIGLLLTILIFAQKKFLKLQPETTIIKLTLLGTIICFSSEVIFQTVRQPTLIADTLNDHIYYFLLGTIGVSLFGTAISFLTAFQLKTKKTGQLILMIIGLMTLANILKYLFPTIGGE